MKDFNQDMLKKVARTMADHHMILPGQSVLVAVSGGIDSVSLLWCLVRLAERLSLSRLGVAHLNHGLRGSAADGDMAFVRQLAGEYGLSFHAELVDIPGFAEKHRLSIEDAARRVRYDFFDRTAAAQGYDKIATGHHADDNAEQVLMGLLRGSGRTGLSGIPPVREGKIIRPLINLTRAEIKTAVEKAGLEFVVDETNDDTGFLRNRVRHELIPCLQRGYNANLTGNLNRLAEIFRAEDEWLEALIDDAFAGMLLKGKGHRVTLSVPLMTAQPRAVQRRLIRKALASLKGDLLKITFERVEAVVGCLDKDQSVTIQMTDGVVVDKDGDRLAFGPASDRAEGITGTGPVFSRNVLDQGAGNDSLIIPDIGVRIDFTVVLPEAVGNVKESRADVAYFDLEKLVFPLTVRNIQPGDRFVPLGMKGHQKVKDFFINNKIPRKQRRACPVVASGGQIIWLAGYRTADPVKVRPGTTRVLKAMIFKKEPRGQEPQRTLDPSTP